MTAKFLKLNANRITNNCDINYIFTYYRAGNITLQ